MSSTAFNEDVLKQALKEALTETLKEQRELFHDIFREVLEDMALSDAIREGLDTPYVNREEVDRIFEDA